MKVYKGTDKNMVCNPSGDNPFQYEIGKTYEKPKAELCKHGFHACEAPLDVLRYYAPGDGSRYFEAELEDVSPERRGDSKVCGKKITLKSEIGFSSLVKAHVQYVKAKCEKANASTGYGSTNASTGYMSTNASTGYGSTNASTGDRSTNASTGNMSTNASTGNRSTNASTGYGSTNASTGYGSTNASTGDMSTNASTGNRSTNASTGDMSTNASTGDRSTNASTGNRSTNASTGYMSTNASTGYGSANISTGNASKNSGGVASVNVGWGKDNKCKGDIGAYLVCSEWGEWDGEKYPLIAAKMAIVDGETIKPDTWYTLENGEFVEVEE